MTKIEALNSLLICDWASSCGELEYVLTDNTEHTRGVLIGSGFSESEVKEASDNDESYIDLSYLAFNYTDANWWTKSDGFLVGEDTQP